MAGFSVRGDFEKLKKLKNGLKNITKPSFKAEIIHGIGLEAEKRVQQCFNAERDPYGRAWKPLKRPRPGQILTKSGRLRASIRMTYSSRSWVMGSPLVYAATQNFGRDWGRGSPIPKRQYIPSFNRLPVAWSKSFRAIATEIVARQLNAG